MELVVIILGWYNPDIANFQNGQTAAAPLLTIYLSKSSLSL